MMHPIEPLPRSLIPLPGESLHGLILRLSHRLDQAPGHVLWRTGLTPGRRSTGLAPKRLLLMLDPSEQQRFAAATRLDPKAVDQLTLRPYFATHPSLAEVMARPAQSPRQRFTPPTWLLFANPRHCPQCLAGDGSEIQRRHGGAWKLQWHLPIVFACLEHRVFLQHGCLACRQRGDSRGRRVIPRLIESPGASGLHPAQCRSRITEGYGAPLCQHRLDSSHPPRIELPPELERLQPELLALLEDTADPSRSLGRLSDLRHLSAIICATWPHSWRGDLTPAVARALSTDLRRPTQPGPDGSTGQHRWDCAPPSAPATAAVLSIATQLLNLPLRELRKELQDLARHAPSNLDPAWGRTWNLLSLKHSPVIEYEVKQAFQSQQPRMPAGHEPVLAPRPHGYRPEHIPQHLPEEWFTVLREASTPRPLPRSLKLRRIAAVQLVQIATGQSMAEAADFLQIPGTWFNGQPRQQLPPLNMHLRTGPFNLTTAFEALASHIGHAPDPIDYRQRRERFASWSLPREDRADLISGLPGAKPHRDLSETRSRLEECASALVWSNLTGSEWRLAPTIDPLTFGAGAALARRSPVGETMTRLLARRDPYVRSLGPLLDEYAAGLAA
ncbi:TniQ family protein [Streptomyces sp. R28]|uniref:TniQ family protein n=1 Tax=Streptomyces sp. R28 TaxID=3238628 RepID=A0AB39PMF9_9ACTN